MTAARKDDPGGRPETAGPGTAADRVDEGLYYRLVQTMNDGLVQIDAQGRITFVNSRFCRMMACTADEVVGRPVSDFLSAPAGDQFRSQMKRRRRGQERSYEIVLTAKDERPVAALVSPRPIFDQAGRFHGSLAVITDVTDLKQAEQALQQAKDDLERRVAERTAMLERANRELRAQMAERTRAEEARRAGEQRLRAIFNAADRVAFVTARRAGDVIEIAEFSPGAEKMFGYARQEVLGRPAAMLHRAEDLPRLAEVVASMFQGQPGFSGELSLVRHGGDQFPALVTTHPLVGETGQATAFLVVAIDLTDLSQARTALADSERRYRAVVEQQTELICRFDPQGKLTLVNEAYCRYFARRREELIGLSVMPFVPEDDRQLAVETLTALTPDRPVTVIEHRVIRPDGRIAWHRWTGQALFDAAGKLVEYQAVSRDITDRKRAEQALRAKERELEARARELEEANTALKVLLDHRHEEKKKLQASVARNVETLVLPYLERLKRGHLDPGQEANLTILETNVRHLVSPFAKRLSSELARLTPTEIRVAQLIRDGKTSKEIAEISNVSVESVNFHRRNIRAKLGLRAKKQNLRSYLECLT